MLKQSPSQTVGPFFHYSLISESGNVMVNARTLGQRIRIGGRVLDGAGDAVPDAMVEIWQADSAGRFNHPKDPQHSQADPNFKGFGRSGTDAEGAFWFQTIKPGAREGVPYIAVRVFSRGMLIHAVSRLYFSDQDNSQDAVLQSIPAERRDTLIAVREEGLEGTLYRWDIRLQGEGETVFFDL
jgi:protocatechuate 3,4-dioxygenase alpha subunit